MKIFSKRFTLVGFLALAFWGGFFLSSVLKSRSFHFLPSRGEQIAWAPTLQTAVKEAEKTHKALFLDFYADWCEYCQEMEKTSYRNPDVVRLSHDFIMAKINVDRHKFLAKYFAVDGLPTLVFVQAPRGEITRLEGYVSAPELIHAMNHVEIRISKSQRS